jgi:hypothetical protein
MTVLLKLSQAFFQDLSVNRCSELVVQFGSGPFLTKLLTQGSDKSDTIVKLSIAAHLFWTCIHPLITKRLFMHQGSNWQAQLLGFLGGWSITYLVAKTYLQRVEASKSATEKSTEAAAVVSKGLVEKLKAVTHNPLNFFPILFNAFDPKIRSMAFTATVIPCAVALASHLHQLYVSRQLSIL